MTANGTEPSKTGKLSNGGLIRIQESVYTQEQLELYLDKIGYHKHKHVIGDTPDAPLTRLKLLMRLHLIAFPFENTFMHYSKDHAPDISPEALFQRFVIDSHGGSYCFGHNTLFMNILRRLGYRVYPTGGRPVMTYADGDPLPAPTHMTLFVQPFDGDPTTYLVDVGWGGFGQIQPILLSDQPEDSVQGTTKTERHRLVKTILPAFALPVPSWRLEITHNPDDPNPTWEPLYIFTEAEVYTADFVASSYALCRAPDKGGYLQENVCAVKYFFVDPENPFECDIGRHRLSGRDIKRSVGADSELVEIFGDGEEKKRVASLQKYFGILIGEEGEKHILDTLAHL